MCIKKHHLLEFLVSILFSSQDQMFQMLIVETALLPSIDIKLNFLVK